MGLCRGCNVAMCADATIDEAQTWMRSKHNVQPSKLPRKVIVLNWANDEESLVEAFAEFSPAGTEVVMVGQRKHNVPNRIRSVRFREVPHHRHGNLGVRIRQVVKTVCM
jgi:hypothetical protein